MLNPNIFYDGLEAAVYDEHPGTAEEAAIGWKNAYSNYAKDGNTSFTFIQSFSPGGLAMLISNLTAAFSDNKQELPSFKTKMNSAFSIFWTTPGNIIFTPNPATTYVVGVGNLSLSLTETYDRGEALSSLTSIFDDYTKTVMVTDTSLGLMDFLE